MLTGPVPMSFLIRTFDCVESTSVRKSKRNMAFLFAFRSLIRTFASEMDKRTSEGYYKESKRIREEVLQQADSLIGNPLRFTITNGITMEVEITKSDLKTIVSKASRDNKFNAIKNALAKDIPGFLKKSEYIGWRTVKEGKHEESAYFAYFDRDLGVRTVLAMRKMKNHGPYKPYAIIDKFSFEATIGELKKGTPL